MPSTPLACVRTRCRTSSVRTAVLYSYALLVHRQHRRAAFVRVAEPRRYAPLSYIRTRCWSTVNIADLRSYALQNLVDTHRCPTFVRAARLPSTSSSCVRMRCRASLVPTAVLHSYALLVYRQHRQPAFVRVAELRWYPLHLYMLPVCTHYSWLHLYMLLVYRQHHRPAFVRVTKLRWYPLLSYSCTCCASAPITAGYIRTCCRSTVNIVDLRSSALQNIVGTHCCPTFEHAVRVPPFPLTTFAHAARMLSTPLTCVHTRCRTSLIRTAVLHSYMLRVCRHYR